MKALTWQGKRDVRIENVPDPAIQKPTDVVVKVTSSGICGSDLHLYEPTPTVRRGPRRPSRCACVQRRVSRDVRGLSVRYPGVPTELDETRDTPRWSDAGARRAPARQRRWAGAFDATLPKRRLRLPRFR
jgi:hypothetical protein